jgi:hypothetical protein
MLAMIFRFVTMCGFLSRFHTVSAVRAEHVDSSAFAQDVVCLSSRGVTTQKTRVDIFAVATTPFLSVPYWEEPFA